MPIAVVCSCGARLKAPDATAGKRVKCPKCGNPIAVPAPEFEYEEVPDDPPMARPAKPKSQLVDDDEEPPRPAKKPKAAPVEVNEAVDDDEDEEEEEAPKKKKKGKRGMGKNREEEKKKRTVRLILGICGAVTALGVMAGVVVAVMSVINNDPAKAGRTTQPTVPAPPPLPPGWSRFQGEGFSVAVPDEIQFKEQDQGPNRPGQPPAGTKVYLNGVQPQPQPNGPPIYIYAANVGPIPPAVAAEFAKSPQAGWEAVKKANGAGAQLQNEKVIQVAGAEGRQYTLTAGFVSGIVKVVVKGEKVYSWVVMSQAAPAEDDPKVKPFFDTFKID